jgi:hypothetical protein
LRTICSGWLWITILLISVSWVQVWATRVWLFAFFKIEFLNVARAGLEVTMLPRLSSNS